MANSDVRAAMATLDTAIQALSTTALEAAAFTAGKESSGPGYRFDLVKQIHMLKVKATATVAEFNSLREIERDTTPAPGSSVPQG